MMYDALWMTRPASTVAACSGRPQRASGTAPSIGTRVYTVRGRGFGSRRTVPACGSASCTRRTKQSSSSASAGRGTRA
eukprot:6307960-Prymnesium_polylepis.1